MQIDIYHTNDAGDTCFLVDEAEYSDIQAHLMAKGISSRVKRRVVTGSAELAVTISIRRLNQALSDYYGRWPDGFGDPRTKKGSDPA
jgi:hypothetical protein